MTITEFLLARIAGAEADPWFDVLTIEGTDRLVTPAEHALVNAQREAWESRVFAECEAKRRIMELHHPSDEFERQACVLCQWDIDCEAPRHEHQYAFGKRDEWPCETVLALASGYADHPDFDDKWRAE